MTLTTMDAKPALVVIDLQQAILALPGVHPVDDIVPRAASLRTCPASAASAAAPVTSRADSGRAQTHLYRIAIVWLTLLRTMSSTDPVQVMTVFRGAGSYHP